MTEHTYLQEDEIVRRGVDILVRTLGPVEAMRFLSMHRQQAMDSIARHRRWQETLDKNRFFEQVFGPDEPRGEPDG